MYRGFNKLAGQALRQHTYKEAGVDIDAGNEFVNAIKHLVLRTRREGADTGLRGFGAGFDLTKLNYAQPVLVAAADGVGTKLRVAIESESRTTIGIDLVAMCVNDLVVQGAEPLFFLDYFATGKLDVESGVEIVSGIAKGCIQAGCALVGGETAEMPGMYKKDDYDLAGFAVGIVERENYLTGSKVKAGNVVFGLASSGLHANGFSLVRNIVSDLGINYQEPSPFDQSRTLGEALLEPTRIYVKSCLAALHSGAVNALAHITGGGFVDNIPRILPDELATVIDVDAWPKKPVFDWLAQNGNIPTEEMLRTFNCGIGMVVISSPESAEKVGNILSAQGETVHRIGLVDYRRDERQVILQGRENIWTG